MATTDINIGKKFSSKEGKLRAFFKALFIVNDIVLQVNDLNVLVSLTLRGSLNKDSKKLVCEELNITSGNLNNILSRLRKMKILVTEDNITLLTPALRQDYSSIIKVTMLLDVSKN